MKRIATYLPLVLLVFTVLGCKETQKKTQKAVANQTFVAAESRELLVGTYTGENSKGIYRLQFDPETATLTDLELVATTENPSYLQISKDKKTVYAVNETKPGTLTSFVWNADRTKLNFMNTASSEGAHPCYIALDPSEGLVAAANYSTGNIALYTLENAATFSDDVQVKQHESGTSLASNETTPKAHFVTFDAQGKYLYAVDLGLDQVLSYPVDAHGNLGNAQVALQLDQGDGPRHLVFHPTRDLVFVVNELSSTVVSAQVDSTSGIFKKIEKISTLPETFTDQSFCADIHITANGNFLYASNRGHNSIAIFKVGENGSLELLGTEAVRGDWPRNFTLTPGDTHMLVANQKSNNITVFKVDALTGQLHFTGQEITVEQPVCIQF
ncbi:lactonase family protein [Arenibacter sp. GZD96]|uniref:lactonase family protein n=1 Tax=Aurantibrevibacter litoralis TaxID=3106030 RepID=UPI002B001E6A|nr:lactonase family protein [Arenibacter sp. GZD-96]MEA1785529.1 lactonase family protein [Arenibacter sp. GZD-96]